MLKVSKQREQQKISQNIYEGRVGLVYARVSSKSQVHDGNGQVGQDFRCQKDLASIGVPHEKSFADTFTGGGDFMNRPAMRALLHYVDTHPHKTFVVVFDDLKRFARDVEFHLKLRSAFRGRNVLLRCLNYKFDESPEGRFVELVLAGSGQLEREQNGRQVIQKQMARLQGGYWPFASRRPFKMNKETHILEAQYPATDYAKIALEGFADGTFVRKIDACRFLVEKGYYPGRNPEKYIDKFTELARCTLNVGFVEYLPWDVKMLEGKHKGFISMETYVLLQKRMKREGLSNRVRMDISPEFPMRGLTLCSGCGKQLTGAPSRSERGKNYSYYVCHTKGCNYYGKSIRKADLENRFKDLLMRTKLKDEVDPLLVKVFERVWKEEVVNVKTQEAISASHKTSLENKAKQLSNAVFEAKVPSVKKIYEAQLEEVAEELENTNWDVPGELDFSIPYRTALDKAKGFLKSPYVVWKALGVHEQHRLFYFIFEEKVPYDMQEGYRTDEIPTAARLFESFAAGSSTDVEMGAIEN